MVLLNYSGYLSNFQLFMLSFDASVLSPHTRACKRLGSIGGVVRAIFGPGKYLRHTCVALRSPDIHLDPRGLCKSFISRVRRDTQLSRLFV